MIHEIEALELNKTWTIVDILSNVHPIGCKLYKIKCLPNESMEHYKAWLVIKGFS